jgi:hypothetical protein
VNHTKEADVISTIQSWQAGGGWSAFCPRDQVGAVRYDADQMDTIRFSVAILAAHNDVPDEDLDRLSPHVVVVPWGATPRVLPYTEVQLDPGYVMSPEGAHLWLPDHLGDLREGETVDEWATRMDYLLGDVLGITNTPDGYERMQELLDVSFADETVRWLVELGAAGVPSPFMESTVLPFPDDFDEREARAAAAALHRIHAMSVEDADRAENVAWFTWVSTQRAIASELVARTAQTWVRWVETLGAAGAVAGYTQMEEAWAAVADALRVDSDGVEHEPVWGPSPATRDRLVQAVAESNPQARNDIVANVVAETARGWAHAVLPALNEWRDVRDQFLAPASGGLDAMRIDTLAPFPNN